MADRPDRRVLGIDEAGRGSLLGPLVVGAFLARERDLPDVVRAGACDSKLLRPAARERVHDALGPLGERRTVERSPAEIDRYVARGRLNELEAEVFAELVRDLAPDVAYVDACDPNARRFGRQVAGLAGGTTRVIARHHADRDLPIVGAASIVAKVRRDRAVAELGRALGVDVGSGYPSDRTTIAFARSALLRSDEPPACLRRSWATMQRIMPARRARALEEFADDRRGGARLHR